MRFLARCLLDGLGAAAMAMAAVCALSLSLWLLFKAFA
jgi:hypothetical protein